MASESPDENTGRVVDLTTAQLLESRDRPGASLDALMETLYGELRSLASAQLHRERAHHTLDTTGLAHEAYLRLVDQKRVDFTDRARFLAAAAVAMRRVLIDHARKVQAEKRGGARQRITLHDDFPAEDTSPQGLGSTRELDLVQLDDALAQLARVHERPARVVQMRYFAGMSVDEVAVVLDLAPRTVKGDFALGRAWLKRKLEASAETGS